MHAPRLNHPGAPYLPYFKCTWKCLFEMGRIQIFVRFKIEDSFLCKILNSKQLSFLGSPTSFAHLTFYALLSTTETQPGRISVDFVFLSPFCLLEVIETLFFFFLLKEMAHKHTMGLPMKWPHWGERVTWTSRQECPIFLVLTLG